LERPIVSQTSEAALDLKVTRLAFDPLSQRLRVVAWLTDALFVPSVVAPRPFERHDVIDDLRADMHAL